MTKFFGIIFETVKIVALVRKSPPSNQNYCSFKSRKLGIANYFLLLNLIVILSIFLVVVVDIVTDSTTYSDEFVQNSWRCNMNMIIFDLQVHGGY